jgi:hypothetical protein
VVMVRAKVSFVPEDIVSEKTSSVILVPKNTKRKNLSRHSMLCANNIHTFSMMVVHANYYSENYDNEMN